MHDSRLPPILNSDLDAAAMTMTEDKLAKVDDHIAAGVAQREDLIQYLADLPHDDPERAEVKRRRDALNEVLTALRRYRRALESVRDI